MSASVSSFEPMVQLCMDDVAWAQLDFDVEPFLEEMAQKVRARVVPWSDEPWEISVLLTHDEGIQPLNAQFRGKDAPTNVLSFGIFESPVTPDLWKVHAHSGVPMLLGDIIFSYDTLVRQAQEEHKTFQNHLGHLMVHGLLHLLGYDHLEEDEAHEMESLECEILSGASIPNPYILESASC